MPGKQGSESFEELFYEGGLEAFVAYLDRKKTPAFEPPIAFMAEKDGNHGGGRRAMERFLP